MFNVLGLNVSGSPSRRRKSASESSRSHRRPSSTASGHTHGSSSSKRRSVGSSSRSEHGRRSEREAPVSSRSVDDYGDERQGRNVSSRSVDDYDREKKERKESSRAVLEEDDQKSEARDSSPEARKSSKRSSRRSTESTSKARDNSPSLITNQFPGQTPVHYAPPPQNSTSTWGAAAEYYGDQGQSVRNQPGVRARTPIITDAEPHLQAASAQPNPPQETGQGLAAEFYGPATASVDNANLSSSTKPRVDTKENSRPSKGSGSNTSSTNPAYYDNNRPSKGSSSNIPSTIPGYYDNNRPSKGSSSNTASTNPGYFDNNRPSKGSSSKTPSSNLGYYAAGAAGVGAAAALAHHHHNKHSAHPQTSSSQSQSYSQESYAGTSQPTRPTYVNDFSEASQSHNRHIHRGPLSRFVDWWRDYEDVEKMEEYTEYLGICKYCFDPNSSPRDAPRQHKPRKRRSMELRNRTKVDKESRYSHSDSVKAAASLTAAGVAAHGLTKAGGHSKRKEKDFDDYSIRAGVGIGSRSSSSDDDKRRSKRPERSVSRGIVESVPQREKRDSRRVSFDQEARDKRNSGHRSSSHGLSEGVTVGTGIGGAGIASGAFSHSGQRPVQTDSLRRRKSTASMSSSSSSSSDQQGFFASFFSPSSKKRRQHEKKQASGFYGTGNQSTDTNLAYGFERSNSKRSKKEGRKSRDDAANAAKALAGLGAAASILAAAEAGKQRRRPTDHAKHREPRQRHQRDTDGQPSDDEWESASEEDQHSDASSGLAFGGSGLGHHASAHSSSESLSSSSSSGTDKWGWRWRNKKRADDQRQHYAAPPYRESQPPKTQPDAPGPLREASTPIRKASTSLPLRHVDPIPVTSPESFDSSFRKSTLPPRPGPVISSPATDLPLQQPKPTSPPKRISYEPPVDREPPAAPRYSKPDLTFAGVFDKDRPVASGDGPESRGGSAKDTARRYRTDSDTLPRRTSTSDKRTEHSRSDRASREPASPSDKPTANAALAGGVAAVVAGAMAMASKEDRVRAHNWESDDENGRRIKSTKKEHIARDFRDEIENTPREPFKADRRVSFKDIPQDAPEGYGLARRRTEPTIGSAAIAAYELREAQSSGTRKRAESPSSSVKTSNIDQGRDSSSFPDIVSEVVRPRTKIISAQSIRHRAESEPIFDDEIFDPDLFKKDFTSKPSASDAPPAPTAPAPTEEQSAKSVFSDLEDRYQQPIASMAEFFAPPDLHSNTRAVDSRVDAEVNEESQRRPSDAAEIYALNHDGVPQPVPRLTIHAPTPPVSVAGSIAGSRPSSRNSVRDASTGEPESIKEEEEEESPKRVERKVKWRDAPSKVSDRGLHKSVDSPAAKDQAWTSPHDDDPPRENRGEKANSASSSANQSPKVDNAASNDRGISKAQSYKSMPGGFEDDNVEQDEPAYDIKPIKNGFHEPLPDVEQKNDGRPSTNGRSKDAVSDGIEKRSLDDDTPTEGSSKSKAKGVSFPWDNEEIKSEAGSSSTGAKSEPPVSHDTWDIPSSKKGKKSRKVRNSYPEYKPEGSHSEVIEESNRDADPSVHNDESYVDAQSEPGYETKLSKKERKKLAKRRSTGQDVDDYFPETSSKRQDDTSEKRRSYDHDTGTRSQAQSSKQNLQDERRREEFMRNSVAGPVAEMVALPDSRPGSPYDEEEPVVTPPRERAPSPTAARTPSSTAIPLFFRRPLHSPGLGRESPASSPATPDTGAPWSTPRARHSRTGSSGMKEFRPLYILERNNFLPDAEEPLPELPSSQTGSETSSVRDGDDGFEDAVESFQNEILDDRSIGDVFTEPEGHLDESYLDSQQTTPRAASFPPGISDEAEPLSDEESPTKPLDSDHLRNALATAVVGGSAAITAAGLASVAHQTPREPKPEQEHIAVEKPSTTHPSTDSKRISKAKTSGTESRDFQKSPGLSESVTEGLSADDLPPISGNSANGPSDWSAVPVKMTKKKGKKKKAQQKTEKAVADIQKEPMVGAFEATASDIPSDGTPAKQIDEQSKDAPSVDAAAAPSNTSLNLEESAVAGSQFTDPRRVSKSYESKNVSNALDTAESDEQIESPGILEPTTSTPSAKRDESTIPQQQPFEAVDGETPVITADRPEGSDSALLPKPNPSKPSKRTKKTRKVVPEPELEPAKPVQSAAIPKSAEIEESTSPRNELNISTNQDSPTAERDAESQDSFRDVEPKPEPALDIADDSSKPRRARRGDGTTDVTYDQTTPHEGDQSLFFFNQRPLASTTAVEEETDHTPLNRSLDTKAVYSEDTSDESSQKPNVFDFMVGGPSPSEEAVADAQEAATYFAEREEETLPTQEEVQEEQPEGTQKNRPFSVFDFLEAKPGDRADLLSQFDEESRQMPEDIVPSSTEEKKVSRPETAQGSHDETPQPYGNRAQQISDLSEREINAESEAEQQLDEGELGGESTGASTATFKREEGYHGQARDQTSLQDASAKSDEAVQHDKDTSSLSKVSDATSSFDTAGSDAGKRSSSVRDLESKKLSPKTGFLGALSAGASAWMMGGTLAKRQKKRSKKAGKKGQSAVSPESDEDDNQSEFAPTDSMATGVADTSTSEVVEPISHVSNDSPPEVISLEDKSLDEHLKSGLNQREIDDISMPAAELQTVSIQEPDADTIATLPDVQSGSPTERSSDQAVFAKDATSTDRPALTEKTDIKPELNAAEDISSSVAFTREAEAQTVDADVDFWPTSSKKKKRKADKKKAKGSTPPDSQNPEYPDLDVADLPTPIENTDPLEESAQASDSAAPNPAQDEAKAEDWAPAITKKKGKGKKDKRLSWADLESPIIESTDLDSQAETKKKIKGKKGKRLSWADLEPPTTEFTDLDSQVEIKDNADSTAKEIQSATEEDQDSSPFISASSKKQKKQKKKGKRVSLADLESIPDESSDQVAERAPTDEIVEAESQDRNDSHAAQDLAGTSKNSEVERSDVSELQTQAESQGLDRANKSVDMSSDNKTSAKYQGRRTLAGDHHSDTEKGSTVETTKAEPDASTRKAAQADEQTSAPDKRSTELPVDVSSAGTDVPSNTDQSRDRGFPRGRRPSLQASVGLTAAAATAATAATLLNADDTYPKTRSDVLHDEELHYDKDADAKATTIEKPLSEPVDAFVTQDVDVKGRVAESPVQEEQDAKDVDVEEPVVEERMIEESVKEEPLAQDAFAQEPLKEVPLAEESLGEKSLVEESSVEDLLAREPVQRGSVVEEPDVEEPDVEEPEVQPMVQDSIVQESNDKESDDGEPAILDSIVDESSVKELAAKMPVVDESATEKFNVKDLATDVPLGKEFSETEPKSEKLSETESLAITPPEQEHLEPHEAEGEPVLSVSLVSEPVGAHPLEPDVKEAELVGAKPAIATSSKIGTQEVSSVDARSPILDQAKSGRNVVEQHDDPEHVPVASTEIQREALSSNEQLDKPEPAHIDKRQEEVEPMVFDLTGIAASSEEHLRDASTSKVVDNETSDARLMQLPPTEVLAQEATKVDVASTGKDDSYPHAYKVVEPDSEAPRVELSSDKDVGRAEPEDANEMLKDPIHEKSAELEKEHLGEEIPAAAEAIESDMPKEDWGIAFSSKKNKKGKKNKRQSVLSQTIASTPDDSAAERDHAEQSPNAPSMEATTMGEVKDADADESWYAPAEKKKGKGKKKNKRQSLASTEEPATNQAVFVDPFADDEEAIATSVPDSTNEMPEGSHVDRGVVSQEPDKDDWAAKPSNKKTKKGKRRSQPLDFTEAEPIVATAEDAERKQHEDLPLAGEDSTRSIAEPSEAVAEEVGEDLWASTSSKKKNKKNKKKKERDSVSATTEVSTVAELKPVDLPAVKDLEESSAQDFLAFQPELESQTGSVTDARQVDERGGKTLSGASTSEDVLAARLTTREGMSATDEGSVPAQVLDEIDDDDAYIIDPPREAQESEPIISAPLPEDLYDTSDQRVEPFDGKSATFIKDNFSKDEETSRGFGHSDLSEPYNQQETQSFTKDVDMEGEKELYPEHDRDFHDSAWFDVIDQAVAKHAEMASDVPAQTNTSLEPLEETTTTNPGSTSSIWQTHDDTEAKTDSQSMAVASHDEGFAEEQIPTTEQSQAGQGDANDQAAVVPTVSEEEDDYKPVKRSKKQKRKDKKAKSGKSSTRGSVSGTGQEELSLEAGQSATAPETPAATTLKTKNKSPNEQTHDVESISEPQNEDQEEGPSQSYPEHARDFHNEAWHSVVLQPTVARLELDNERQSNNEKWTESIAHELPEHSTEREVGPELPRQIPTESPTSELPTANQVVNQNAVDTDMATQPSVQKSENDLPIDISEHGVSMENPPRTEDYPASGSVPRVSSSFEHQVDETSGNELPSPPQKEVSIESQPPVIEEDSKKAFRREDPSFEDIVNATLGNAGFDSKSLEAASKAEDGMADDTVDFGPSSRRSPSPKAGSPPRPSDTWASYSPSRSNEDLGDLSRQHQTPTNTVGKAVEAFESNSNIGKGKDVERDLMDDMSVGTAGVAFAKAALASEPKSKKQKGKKKKRQVQVAPWDDPELKEDKKIVSDVQPKRDLGQSEDTSREPATTKHANFSEEDMPLDKAGGDQAHDTDRQVDNVDVVSRDNRSRDLESGDHTTGSAANTIFDSDDASPDTIGVHSDKTNEQSKTIMESHSSEEGALKGEPGAYPPHDSQYHDTAWASVFQTAQPSDKAVGSMSHGSPATSRPFEGFETPATPKTPATQRPKLMTATTQSLLDAEAGKAAGPTAMVWDDEASRDMQEPNPIDPESKERDSHLFRTPPSDKKTRLTPKSVRSEDIHDIAEEPNAETPAPNVAKASRNLDTSTPSHKSHSREPSRDLHPIAEDDQRSFSRGERFNNEDFDSRFHWPTPNDDTSESIDAALARSEASSSRPKANIASPLSPELRSSAMSPIGARSVDQARPSSAMSARSGTSSHSRAPSLRRIDRSASSDLRASNKRAEIIAKNAKQEDTRSASPAASDVASEKSIRRMPSYDPLRGSGRDRKSDIMTQDNTSYEGWGDAPGSPLTPSRPPSVRKRQSLQIIELENRLAQAMDENKTLRRGSRGIDTSSRDFDSGSFSPSRDSPFRERDGEIRSLKASLQMLRDEVSRLTEQNADLQQANKDLSNDTTGRYAQLQQEHNQTHEQWQQASKELAALKDQQSELNRGMEDVVRAEISTALAAKDAEIQSLREELADATDQVRDLHRQLVASTGDNSFLVTRDMAYFSDQCSKLCQHVQQWVLRFSKYSDNKIARLSTDITDDNVETRLDNSILDGSDVDIQLKDRVRRRDVFNSVVMNMIWEFVFTRYLFGMDRDQRQKLKSLEKTLTEVGPARAVAQWRVITLSLLSRREAFHEQRSDDTEAVVQEIYGFLAKILPPPRDNVNTLQDSLRNVLRIAVDLSIEMRTQRPEFIMLPPLKPEYDTKGDLVRKFYFNAALMSERSGEAAPDDELQSSQAVVRMVLFPLVVKKGNESGSSEEEEVVYKAQVLVARPKDKRTSRAKSLASNTQASRSVQSLFPPSVKEAGQSDVRPGSREQDIDIADVV